MLKNKISKDSFEKLDPLLQAEYKANGDAYFLQTEDASELKRAKDREATLRREAESNIVNLENKVAELSKGNGADIATLERSWEEKNENQKKEYEAKLKAKDSFIEKTLVENVANSLAAEISTSPALILPHIKARLTADLEGDKPSTKVLDSEGKASALTIDELKKEFVENKDFSKIIVGSKASGSGASNPTNTNVSQTSGKANEGGEVMLKTLSAQELKVQMASIIENKKE